MCSISAQEPQLWETMYQQLLDFFLLTTYNINV